MKKTFFYNFVPFKAEEEAYKESNTPWIVTRRLVEIRNIYLVPIIDLHNPWKIKKTITHYETIVGKLVLPFVEAFEHIFQYWTLDTTRFVTSGHKKNIDLWDFTEENNPKICHNKGTFIEMLPNEDYAIVCADLFKNRELHVNDEVGQYWNARFHI